MAILTGTTGNETITGTSGWDTLYGLQGDDILVGGTGNDILSGGAGNDALRGGLGADSLHGGAGNDTFRYLSFAEANGDIIQDFASGDRISFASISGATFIGNAQFSGVAGQIRYSSTFNMTYSYYPNYYWVELNQTIVEIDTDGDAEANYSFYLNGSFNLTETALGSNILMIAPNQTLNGTADPDTLTGGAGNDVISGAEGNDLLIGGEGHDNLLGGNGNDTLDGGFGMDTHTGGAGNDIFRFTAPDEIASDTVTDFNADDTLVFAFPGMTYIADNLFTTTPGEFRFSEGMFSFDFDGDGYADTSLILSNFNGMVEETTPGSGQLLQAANINSTGTAAGETLLGGNGNDSINGMGGNDILRGFVGRDTLNGGLGNDRLEGGSGADTLKGGDGADTLIGGIGADILTGGAGNDKFKFNSFEELGEGPYAYSSYSTGQETIADLTVGDTIDLSALAGLSFAGVGNSFTGVANQVMVQNNYSYSLLSIDTNGDGSAEYSLFLSGVNAAIEETAAGSKIFRVAANLVLNGTATNNVLNGGNGNDSLNGLGGNDTLNGGYGTDTLHGGTGADVLVGGLGSDTLTGGGGNDVFRYNALAELNDTITDMAAGDRIDLGALEGLSFAGVGKDFTGVANQVRVQSQYGATTLSIDTNGDKIADYGLGLNGEVTLVETAAGSQIYRLATNLALNGTSDNDTLNGGYGNDSLSGLDGDDTLNGGYGSDSLSGGDGNDVLIGGLGGDSLTGGSGDDVFKYNAVADFAGTYPNYDTIADLSVGDKIDLSALSKLSFVGVGNDYTGEINQIRTQSGYYDYLEIDVNGDKQTDYRLDLGYLNLTLEETTAGSNIFQLAPSLSLSAGPDGDTLVGGSSNDFLAGNLGGDRLIGGYGNDELYGGDGSNTFVFNSTLNTYNNVDSIRDWIISYEYPYDHNTIELDQSIFTNLDVGSLNSDHFCASTNGMAADGDDYILYNTSTGALLYDADGSGMDAVAVQFATLTTHPDITAGTFHVVS